MFLVFLLQASWRHITWLSRTVKVYRQCLIKTAMPFPLIYDILYILNKRKWHSCNQTEAFEKYPSSLFLSGCWWTRSCTSLLLWKKWLCQWVMNGCGSETMWRKTVTSFFSQRLLMFSPKIWIVHSNNKAVTIANRQGSNFVQRIFVAAPKPKLNNGKAAQM